MHPLRAVFGTSLLLLLLLPLTSGCSDKQLLEEASVSKVGSPVSEHAEPAPGEYPQRGPEDGPDRPVNAGPNASESCVRPGRVEGPKVSVSGVIEAPSGLPRGSDGRFLVLAMDQRVDTLAPNRVLDVYGLVAVDEERFDLSFAAPDGPFWLCAVGPAALGGVEYFSTMGCTQSPLRPQDFADGSPPPQHITLHRGRGHLGLIGLSQFDTRLRAGSRVRRTLSGTIEIGGSRPSSHFIAAAAVNVLGGSDVAEDPRVVGAVASGQQFKLSYLAAPSEPLWLCAIALPPDGKTASEVDSLSGAGCARVQVPSGNEPITLDGIVHRLDSNQPVPLTPHEREHYTLLQRCFLD